MYLLFPFSVMIKKFDMKLTKIVPLIVLIVFAINAIAQQFPPQTVVFKVRKVVKKVEVVSGEEPAFVIVEENASFQGGDVNTFRIWVQHNMGYPDSAVEANISGRIIVQFSVDHKGKVCDVNILRGVHPLLDKEAIRAILKSPQWVPGKQGGKPVKQQFVIPIIFSLQ